METSQVQSVLPEGYILQAPANTYRIEKTLGMGGFGITYLATTTVQFGNLKTTISVAIKEHFISDSCERDTQTHSIVYSNPVKNRVEGSRRDFIAEARRLQKVGIEHPNIVKVNEVFETNNTAYYVMEYLEGKSLRAYVKQRGKLEENEMLALMRPIMSAVRLLHEHYMTHLDIKPDNIMLTTDEHGNARPVLIDFGLSKHYGKDGRPTSTINTLGCSDGYAPVEQYAGITTFSPSADIYALGATMLFCLTDKDPKKSVDFKEVDKEALLNSLSLTDDTRRMLLSALQMDASQRRFPTEKKADDTDKGSGSKKKSGQTVILEGTSGETHHSSSWRSWLTAVTTVLLSALWVSLLLYLPRIPTYYIYYQWTPYAEHLSYIILVIMVTGCYLLPYCKLLGTRKFPPVMLWIAISLLLLIPLFLFNMGDEFLAFVDSWLIALGLLSFIKTQKYAKLINIALYIAGMAACIFGIIATNISYRY